MFKHLFLGLCFVLLVNMQGFGQTDLGKLSKTMYEEFLFDPGSAGFVSVHYNMPSCWGDFFPTQFYGWRPSNDSAIYLIDKVFFLYPSECISVNDTSFTQVVESNYLVVADEEVFNRMDRIAAGGTSIHPLAIAAWCNSKGYKDLGTKVAEQWEKTNEKTDPKNSLSEWHGELMWGAFAGLVHHYMMRKDIIAERHGVQIRNLYPMIGLEYDQAEPVILELERRKQVSHFNNKPDSIPPEYKNWGWKEKAHFIISRLDEVDQRQWGQPGGVSLGYDWRVRELVAIGDSVVPLLIDVIETDKRFTRSVHFWRDFSQDRTVLNVKEVALTAIMSIWQDPLFEPASTGDNFTSRGDLQAAMLAEQLRIQLKSYEGKTLDVRKVEILQDHTKETYDRREAASLLANYGAEMIYGTMVWTNRLSGRDSSKNPLIDKWKNPSIAEMIWEELQYDMKNVERKIGAKSWDGFGNMVTDYLYSLIDLGDKSILPTIVDAYNKENIDEVKRKLAYAAYWLGDNKPWTDYCMLIQKEKIKLPSIKYVDYNYGGSIEYNNPGAQPGYWELRGIVSYLASIPDSISQATYDMITNPGHPYYQWLEIRVLQLTGGYGDDYDEDYLFLRTPWALKILEKNLDNRDSSNISVKYYVGSGMTAASDWGGQSGLRMHEMWDTSDYCKGDDIKLRARNCDMAASMLYELIFGIPVCHVHMADKDDRIEQQKAFLKRFTKLREINHWEYNTVNELYSGTRYVPDIPKLDHPATDDDVNKGRAIFSMPGNTVADVGLPAWAINKKDANTDKKYTLKYLLVQAEYNSKGELIYGAFTEDGPKTIAASELINIEVYPKE